MGKKSFENFLKEIAGFANEISASINLVFLKGRRDRMEIWVDLSKFESSLEKQVCDFFQKLIISISKNEVSDVASAYVEFSIHNRVACEEIGKNFLRVVLSLVFLVNSPKVFSNLKKKFKKIGRKPVIYPKKVFHITDIYDFRATFPE